MGSVSYENNGICVIEKAKSLTDAKRVINWIIADVPTTVVEGPMPSRFDTAMVLSVRPESYQLYEVRDDGRLGRRVFVLVVGQEEPIPFDAQAFLDLTGGEQASLLHSMKPGERIRLAIDIAAYFRSCGHTSYAHGVLDGFYSLMSLRGEIAGRSVKQPHCTTTPNNLQMEAGR